MADLIINGTTQTLYGSQNYGIVQIINGGILYVQAYNGTSGTGSLQLNATSISIDATSQINADYRGYRGEQSTSGGGEGPGHGSGGGFSGSGAGYGGAGGGVYSPPGPTYGTTSGTDVDLGSGGGCGVYFSSYGRGGNGGGLIKLSANTITINGTITSIGEGGTTGSGQHGSGGGSGGGIYIDGGNVTISGTLRANGGNGSGASGSPRYGGDGGGGGRIKIFHTGTLNTAGSTITINGGSGGPGNGAPSGQNGSVGTTYSAFTGSTLNISSTPTGARVWLRTPSCTGTCPAYIDQGVTTNTSIGVIPGTYDIKLTLSGYQDWYLLNQSYTAGQTVPISATLILVPGSLAITSTPSGASIYINGSLQTGVTTPATVSNLSPSPPSYSVTLRLTGYQDWTGSYDVITNQTTNVTATFAPSAYFNSTPSGASIYIDTILQGSTTPATITNLSIGSHAYKLILVGYNVESGNFTTTGGQTTNISRILSGTAIAFLAAGD